MTTEDGRAVFGEVLTEDGLAVIAGRTEAGRWVSAAAPIELVIQDAVHTHAADGVTIVVAIPLSVADAVHGHAADLLTLTTVENLIVQEALHGHTVDVLVLNQLDLVLVLYDAGEQVQGVRLGGTADEHAAQCLALETLRVLRENGFTTQTYNDLDALGWHEVTTEAVANTTANSLADVATLLMTDTSSATNLGGNYFEHGYGAILASAGVTVTFTKNGLV